MELLFDPPNHQRLPDPDAEIVDRALAVQTLAGRPVTMVTYDVSMALRARYAGLKVVSRLTPSRKTRQDPDAVAELLWQHVQAVTAPGQ